MKYSYRITKYGHSKSTGDNDEWTSFHDIGKSVSNEEYLVVEADYIETVIAICQCLGVSSMSVSGLELYSELESYTEGQKIEVGRLAAVIKAILRERIWCKLKSPVCEFHFGYDYYMYLVSEVDAGHCLPRERSRLNFEVFPSPYLDQSI